MSGPGDRRAAIRAQIARRAEQALLERIRGDRSGQQTLDLWARTEEVAGDAS